MHLNARRAFSLPHHLTPTTPHHACPTLPALAAHARSPHYHTRARNTRHHSCHRRSASKTHNGISSGYTNPLLDMAYRFRRIVARRARLSHPSRYHTRLAPLGIRRAHFRTHTARSSPARTRYGLVYKTTTSRVARTRPAHAFTGGMTGPAADIVTSAKQTFAFIDGDSQRGLLEGRQGMDKTLRTREHALRCRAAPRQNATGRPASLGRSIRPSLAYFPMPLSLCNTITHATVDAARWHCRATRSAPAAGRRRVRYHRRRLSPISSSPFSASCLYTPHYASSS